MNNGVVNNNIVNNNQVTNNKNSKMFFKILIVFALIVVICMEGTYLTKLLNSNKLANREIENDRTIMIYMSPTTLESESDYGSATLDLSYLDYEKLSANDIKVVMIAGGTNSWENDYIDIESTSIYELTADGFKIVKEQKLLNMGEPSTLSGFLNYVYENYASNKYDFIFYGHGSATYGNEPDEISSDQLYLSEWKTALKDSYFNEKNKLEVMIFRNCLEATLEGASIIKDYAEYMVASEEVSYSHPDFTTLNCLNSITKDDTGLEIGKLFVDNYEYDLENAFCGGYSSYCMQQVYASLDPTYSVINLSNMSNLVDMVNDFYSTIDVKSNFNKIASIRSSLYSYGNVRSYDDYDTVDLYQLTDALSDYSSTNAQELLSAIKEAVVYNYSLDDYSTGISVYFPYKATEKTQDIIMYVHNFSGLEDYTEFITTFKNINSGSSSFAIGDENEAYNTTLVPSTVTKSNNLYGMSLTLTDDQLEDYTRSSYYIFKSIGDGYYTPIYQGKEVNLDGSTMTTSTDARILTVSSNSSTSIITLYETNSDDEYIYYTGVGYLSNTVITSASDGKAAYINYLYNKSTNEMSIISATAYKKTNDDGITTASGAILDLSKYNYIYISNLEYKLLSDDGNVIHDWLDSEKELSGFEIDLSNYKLTVSNVDDSNDYYGMFVIYDINNDEHYSEIIKVN